MTREKGLEKGTSQKRIGWIDEYKGFVLLLVCLFHVEQSFKCIDMGMLHLSAFRMSAFFFISGVLFSTRRFSDFKSYATHKTKVLLLPYILLSLLFLALDPVVGNFDWFPRAPKMTVMNIRPVIENVWDYIYWNLAKIFVAGKSSIGSGPIWFVFTLYSISLMFFGVQKLAEKISLRLRRRFSAPQHCMECGGSPNEHTHCSHGGPGGGIPCVIIGFAGGWLLYRNHIRLPFGIERDLTCLGFFAGGWLCKKPIQFVSNWIEEKPSVARNLAVFAVAVIAFILYGFVEKPDPYFSIMNNDLGKSAVNFFASSAFGIVGLVATFQLCSRLPDVAPIRVTKGILRNISRNALIILAVHWWVLLVLRIIWKTEMDKPGIAYLSIPIVIAVVVGTIPLFRCQFYKLIGKEKISVRESLSIK